MTAAFVLGTIAKVTLVFTLGWAISSLLRTRAASLRHLVWTVTIVAAAAIAPLSLLLPTVEVPLLPGSALPTAAPKPVQDIDMAAAADPMMTPAQATIGVTESVAPVAEAPVPRHARMGNPASSLPLLWLLGVAVVLGWYGLGHLGIASVVRRATPLTSGPWHRLLHDVSGHGGVVSRVRLLRSAAVGSPVIWGIRRPVILLPADAEGWGEERARVVLRHELAHARRLDGAAQFAATVACALYWFHPLAWLAARRLRNESERACDDAVLATGEAGSDYAAHLLDVARGARHLRIGGSAVIGMARPTHLEGRLLAVLDEGRVRRSASWAGAIAGGGMAAVILPLAALRPGPAESSRDAALVTLPPVVAVRPAPVPLASVVPSVTVAVTEADTTFERVVEARPGERLTLDLETGGAVVIRGWDRNQVSVRAHLAGDDWRNSAVEVERVSDGVRLYAYPARRARVSSTSHDFEIWVPKRFDIQIESAGGGVSISDVDGVFTGHTEGGDLALHRTIGRAELRTGGGEIRVTDSQLEGAVQTGGGRVQVSGGSPGLTATSGSGPVISGSVTGLGLTADRRSGSVSLSAGGAIVSNGVVSRGLSDSVIAQRVGTSGGAVPMITQAGGGIVLDEAPHGATIRTGGGDIQVGRSGGPIEAHTGGGDVMLDHVAGSVVATSGAGRVEIRVEGDGDDERSVSVVTVGDVILHLPASLLIEFDLESGYTRNFERAARIQSDWELRREETTTWDGSRGTPRRYVRATGTTGTASGGPVSHIRVRTTNGDITILRD